MTNVGGTADGAIKLDAQAGGVEIGAKTKLSLTSEDDTNLTMNANDDNNAKTLTIAATNGGTEGAGIVLDADTSVKIDIDGGDDGIDTVVCVERATVDDVQNVGKVSITGELEVTGEITCSSDASLKTNIRNIDDAEEKLLSLNGVAFDWIGTGKSTYGIIAQDVEEILPEAVSGTEGEKKVNYNCVVSLLIEAMKEQSERINELEDIIRNFDN